MVGLVDARAADRDRAPERSRGYFRQSVPAIQLESDGVKLRRVLLGILLLLLVAGGVFAWQIGPRNIIGMLRYDQRREGKLKVGDAAPDVVLAKLDGGEAHLSDYVGGQPLVLVFGSFT